MRKTWILAAVPGAIAVGLGVMAGVIVIALFVVKLLWAWTIPDLFPGAVRQGLIARDISWLTALKVAIFVGVLNGIPRGSRGRERGE